MEGNRSRRKFSFSSLPYKKQKIVISLVFLFVPMLLLLTFTYLPATTMFKYALTDWDGISKTYNYVGLKNFNTIFADPKKYFEPMRVSIYYFIASFVQIALAVILAYLISFKTKFSNIFKGVYFFPSLINSVAISFIFIFFFQPNGTFDSILKLLGLEGAIRFWLRDPKIINISLASVSVWRYVGQNIVMFSAAMQSISPDILEAAEVDGANEFQKLIHIIIPGISKIMGLLLFLSISGSLQAFETPYIMTGGGNGSMTYVIQVVNIAFQNHRVGLASALALILLFICIILALIRKLIFGRKEA
ncbi:carbohydrate ABC transporter permease [Clostridium thermarum]|uniref:carbohydrate ABC transporter permease n=1 Tax=Clostridium thermarum TaxID=1716543 RepID=UPI0013D123C8|nr:sugar ABC transporter permease [Clostridium thermarum]